MDKTSGGSVTRTVAYYPVGGATLAPGASAGVRINSTLYYVLKDHLGSASVVTDSSGVTVGEQRYYPYGETRFTSGALYTDKLYTGQREMSGLGIYHYGARFYSQRLGRFLSADTIVPNPLNPQDLNRFSYVLNNPLKYIDPSGHIIEKGLYAGDADFGFSQMYGVVFTGDFSKKGWGNTANMTAAIEAIKKVGEKFAETLGGSPASAFQFGFGTDTTPLILHWRNSSSKYFVSTECQGITSGACNTGVTQDTQGNTVMLISFASMCCYPESMRNNVVHESGHLFNNIHGGAPASLAGNYAVDRSQILRPFDGVQWQLNTFYDPDSPGVTNSEMFGDMFVAWVFDSWNTDPANARKVEDARNDMITNMVEWLGR